MLDYCQTDPCGISRCPETKCVATPADPFFECVCDCCQTGVYCLVQVDECASNPCQNSGTCVDGGCGFTCVCTQPWTGETCETDIDECAFTPCSNGAGCTHIPAAGNESGPWFKCDCPCGWTGAICGIDLDECVSGPCQNNGTCTEGMDPSQLCHHACDCVKGFTGYLCEIDIDECESVPCWNDGVCTTKQDGTETPDFYACDCLPTHNSLDIDHCGHDINECENLNSTTECKNGAYCFQSNLYSNVNSELRVNNLLYPDNPYYQCSCIPGFTGQLCEIDINECESSPCKAGAICSDGIYFYSCNCPTGYSGVN